MNCLDKSQDAHPFGSYASWALPSSRAALSASEKTGSYPGKQACPERDRWRPMHASPEGGELLQTASWRTPVLVINRQNTRARARRGGHRDCDHDEEPPQPLCLQPYKNWPGPKPCSRWNYCSVQPANACTSCIWDCRHSRVLTADDPISVAKHQRLLAGRLLRAFAFATCSREVTPMPPASLGCGV